MYVLFVISLDFLRPLGPESIHKSCVHQFNDRLRVAADLLSVLIFRMKKIYAFVTQLQYVCSMGW